MTGRKAKLFLWTSLLPAVAWLAGCTCTGSLRPLESDEPLTAAPDLSGKWMSDAKDSSQDEYFLVENTGGQTFCVTVVNESEDLKDVYDLSLVRVGSYVFFDAAFKETAIRETSKSAYDLGVLPIHFIGRVWAEGDKLRLALLDYDWMSHMASSGRLKVPYVQEDEGDDHILLLTAKGDELRDFLRQYADDAAAFPEAETFRRVSRTDKPTTD